MSLRDREAQRLFALASDHHRYGRLDDAIRGYVRVLGLNPRFSDAYNNLGVALRAQGKFEAAVACYRRSLALKSDNAGVFSNLGNVLRDLGRLDMAGAAHREAVRLAPGSPEAVYNLGLVLRDLGHDDNALECFEQALKMRAGYVDASWDRALSLLLRGDLKEGLKEYEWRWKLPHHPPRTFAQPMWDGSPIKGRTILLHHEQGFGDMIQFARFVPLLKEQGANVVVECQPELARLMATLDRIDRVVMRGAPLPPFDVWAPMLSLGRLMGTRLETVPHRVPYLSPPRMHNLVLGQPRGTYLKVGISWAGKPTHKNDRNRSCSFSEFIELTGLNGIAFYSLQKGEAAAELDTFGCAALVEDVGGRIQDFADSAAVISQLDLVISVDTAVVHLAGALGRPVWTLLPLAPDWRWMLRRDDSPWYPTMRLFRQPKPGDWRSVFIAVRKGLQAILVDKAEALRKARESGANRPPGAGPRLASSANDSPAAPE